MIKYHVFLSYARADETLLRSASGEGWVTAFHRRLLVQHQSYSRRPLSVFFDKAEILDNEDWERRIFRGLRTSSLLLAFLSPEYIKSPWCRREWEEYLRMEHTLARGDDGIQSIYFVHVPELDGQASRAQLDANISSWIAEINRRQRGAGFDLRDWYVEGPAVLRELDTVERSAKLRPHPRFETDRKLVTLANRIAHIDRAIAKRLDRATLAELAPGNLDAFYEHFVGRSAELRQLHSRLIADRIGLIGALHGLGGQGKTALAIQYAYAYAETYAAGGRWVLPAEGLKDIALVLEPLIWLLGLYVPRQPDTLAGTEAHRFKVNAMIAALRKWTHDNVAVVSDTLSRDARRHCGAGDLPEIAPHMLLILDNVDQPELLSAAERVLITREDWLQVVVTTRLDPRAFGDNTASIATITVDDLPLADAVALLRDFRSFESDDEREAARAIASALSGFTLAIELVGAYLQAKPDVSYRGYLARLNREGLRGADSLAEDAETRQRIRHRQAQIGPILSDAIATLPPAARQALTFASLMPVDYIVLDWLRTLTSAQHPGVALSAVRSGYADPWEEIVRLLIGRRLLTVVTFDQTDKRVVRTARLHRLVAEHIVAGMSLAECEVRVAALITFVGELSMSFEDTWRKDPSIFWQLRPLQETITRLMVEAPESRALATANIITATAELETGQLMSAGRSFAESHRTLKRLLDAAPSSAASVRDVSVSLERLADFYMRRRQSGDMDEALECHRESVTAIKRLREMNPGSAEAARDVSVSLNKLGSFYLSRRRPGDMRVARECFQESLGIAKRLLVEQPGSVAATRDALASLERLGDSYSTDFGSESEMAVECFEETLSLARHVFKANPNSAEAARDVSVSLNKLGGRYLSRRRREDRRPEEKAAAGEYFRESLGIARRLMAANPSSIESARDVSLCLNRLGDFWSIWNKEEPGAMDKALEYFQESLGMRRLLLKTNPNSADAARDVSVSLNRMGSCYMARDRVGDLEQARRCFQESFDLADKLLDADPSSGSAAGDVMTALNGLAASYRKGNQPGIANGFETDYRTMIGQAQSQRMRQNFRLMTLARRAVVHLPQNSRAPSLIWFRSSMPDVAKLADVYKDRPADFEEAYYNVFVWPDETALRLDEQTLLKALKEAREEAQKSDGPSAWRSWTSHAVGKLVSLGVDQQNAIAYMEAVAAAEKAAIRAMVAAAETRINERAAKPE